MFSHLGVTSSVAFSTGETLTGGTSGATGIVEAITATTSTDQIRLSLKTVSILLTRQMVMTLS